MKTCLFPAQTLALTLALACPLVRADDEALRRCRALAAPGPRLACYDALPLAPAGAAAPAPRAAAPTTAAAAPGAPPQRSMAAIAPLPDTPPARPAATTASAVAAFGAEAARPELSEITSAITGDFEGWGPRTRIRLANGQVWQISDDSEGAYFLHSPRVTIQRALLGGFVMEIEGARRAPRVRRIE